MLQDKVLTAKEVEAMIEELDSIADRLFLAGENTLGNNTQEIAYCLHARLVDIEEAEA